MWNKLQLQGLLKMFFKLFMFHTDSIPLHVHSKWFFRWIASFELRIWLHHILRFLRQEIGQLCPRRLRGFLLSNRRSEKNDSHSICGEKWDQSSQLQKHKTVTLGSTLIQLAGGHHQLLHFSPGWLRGLSSFRLSGGRIAQAPWWQCCCDSCWLAAFFHSSYVARKRNGKRINKMENNFTDATS